MLPYTYTFYVSGSMDGDLKEMHLLPEPLFTIPSDNIHFLCIYGTPSGRIFLGGRDGCIYEIRYQVGSYYSAKSMSRVGHLDEGSKRDEVDAVIKAMLTEQVPVLLEFW